MAKLIARIEDGHVVITDSQLIESKIEISDVFAKFAEPLESDYCPTCNGTGENQFDVGRCGDCKGSGFHS